MTEDTAVASKDLVARAPHPLVRDIGAPGIFFDAVPAMSHINGVYYMLLACQRLAPMSNGDVPGIPTAVAQIHGNREALIALRHAIDGALLLGQKAEGQTN